MPKTYTVEIGLEAGIWTISDVYSVEKLDDPDTQWIIVKTEKDIHFVKANNIYSVSLSLNA